MNGVLVPEQEPAAARAVSVPDGLSPTVREEGAGTARAVATSARRAAMHFMASRMRIEALR